MSQSRLLLRRRGLLCVGILAMLFAFAMLHPYSRQSLFGPKIHGEPWCVWEEEFRRERNRELWPDIRRALETIDPERRD